MARPTTLATPPAGVAGAADEALDLSYLRTSSTTDTRVFDWSGARLLLSLGHFAGASREAKGNPVRREAKPELPPQL